MTLTKAQIDELVDGLDRTCWGEALVGDSRPQVAVLRRALYRSAGLTATGERKPERVRCWMWTRIRDGASGGFGETEPKQKDAEMLGFRITPGWFVPSEEGE